MVTTKGRRACALREREGHGQGSGHLEHFHFLTEVAAPQVSVFRSFTELHIVILCTFYRQVTLCHRERLRNLHTHPHPIIQPASYYPAMHRGRPGPGLKPARDTWEPVSIFRTLGGKSCLPRPLRVPSTGEKGGQRGCASWKPCAVGFGLEGVRPLFW